MLEKIKNLIGKPAGWMYFILVVVLLIIISNNSSVKANLQAELDNANTEISALEALNETTLEAMAGEVAVRDDAIVGLNDVIAGLESDSVAVNAKLNDSDSLRGELESTVADLESQLNASASSLEDAIANPNCPVAVTE